VSQNNPLLIFATNSLQSKNILLFNSSTQKRV